MKKGPVWALELPVYASHRASEMPQPSQADNQGDQTRGLHRFVVAAKVENENATA
jgi:hypothetical protein